MTAIPQTGVGRLPLRGRVGARIIRPGTAATRTPAGPATASASAASTVGSATTGGFSLPSRAAALGSLSGSMGGRSMRFVLAGARVRLGSRAFMLVVLGTLSLTLATLLFLNTSLAQDSFRLTDIRQQAKDLQLQEQILTGQLAAAESPVGLGQRAVELGMVLPNGPSQYLNLDTGALIGVENPGIAAPAKRVKTPKPTQAPMPSTDPNATTGTGSEVAGEVAVDPSTGLPLAGATGNGAVAGTLPGPTPAPTAPTGPGGEQPLGFLGGGHG